MFEKQCGRKCGIHFSNTRTSRDNRRSINRAGREDEALNSGDHQACDSRFDRSDFAGDSNDRDRLAVRFLCLCMSAAQRQYKKRRQNA